MLIIDCKNRKDGFTIVELIVVIVTIGIITASTSFAYTNIQKQSRDNHRASDATVVVEGLERYYTANGDYPSVSKITASDATSVKQLLKLDKIDSLVAQNAAPGTSVNIWKAGSATPTNMLTYTGNSDGTSSCLTGTATTDVCDDFKVQYYKEDSGTVETIYSRFKAPAAPATPPPPVIASPTAPTLVAGLNGSAAEATRSDTSCRAGASVLYAFRSRTNDGAWGNYSAWAQSPSVSATAAQGVKYGFQVKAKCVEGDYSSSDAVSSEATYIHPINTPSVPVLTVTPAADGDSATWNWPAISCPAGATVQYDTQFYRDDATGWRAYDGATQSTPSVTYTTNYEGYDHRARAKARCVTAFATSSWSGDSNSPSYIHPVTAPGNVTNYRWSTYNGDPTLAWTEPTCGLGTRLDRRWWSHLEGKQYFADGTSTTTSSSFIIFNSTRPDGTNTGQWRNSAPVLVSQLDMSKINIRAWVVASTQLSAYLVFAGSPNTDSQNTEATKGAVQLRCINPVTGRLADGNITFSGWFTR
jgi:Tfp pilus assembly protein PilE